MEIDLHGIRRPDGARVSVVVDGKLAQEVVLRRGFARLRVSSAEGETVPEVEYGSVVEVREVGEVLA